MTFHITARAADKFNILEYSHLPYWKELLLLLKNQSLPAALKISLSTKLASLTMWLDVAPPHRIVWKMHIAQIDQRAGLGIFGSQQPNLPSSLCYLFCFCKFIFRQSGISLFIFWKGTQQWKLPKMKQMTIVSVVPTGLWFQFEYFSCSMLTAYHPCFLWKIHIGM